LQDTLYRLAGNSFASGQMEGRDGDIALAAMTTKAQHVAEGDQAFALRRGQR
jgi:hypothetical protein